MVSSREGDRSPSSWLRVVLSLYSHSKPLFSKHSSPGGWIGRVFEQLPQCARTIPLYTTAYTIVLRLDHLPDPPLLMMDSVWAPLMFSNSSASWSKLSQFIRKGLIILDFQTDVSRIPSLLLPLGSLIPVWNTIIFFFFSREGLCTSKGSAFKGVSGFYSPFSTAVIAKLTYICIMKRRNSYMTQNNKIYFEVTFCLS